MDVLKEFLETSTIHGLAYISTAQVIIKKELNDLFDFLEQGCKSSMVHNSMLGLLGRFPPDQQVLL